MSTPWYGGAKEWTTLLSDAAEGAGQSFRNNAQYAQHKREARELKRQTAADLLNKASRRNQNLFRVKQEYGDEMNDFGSQALQHIARGFVESLRGSTRRG